MKMELRMNVSEIRVDENNGLFVSGYVNKTEETSNILGHTRKFIEKISKGAFSKAIESTKGDIDFLAEHDNNRILSSTRNNSLKLYEDEKGLFMEAEITPTSWGRDTYTLIKSGIYRNMSFGFKVIKDKWRKVENDLYERTIDELELFEVSVVKNPAYSQSSIAARGIDLIEEVGIPKNIQEETAKMDEKLKEFILTLAEALKTLTEEIQDGEPKVEVEDVEEEEKETKDDENKAGVDNKSAKDSDDKVEDEEDDEKRSLENINAEILSRIEEIKKAVVK